MKTFFPTLIALILFAPLAHAETFIELSSSPGYVEPAAYYEKDCKIDTEGNLAYTYSRPVNGKLQVVKSKTKKLSPSDLSKLNQWVSESRNTPKPYPHYNDYGGDVPGFELVAFPDQASELLAVHYHGTNLTAASSAAKSLLNKTKHRCGMTLELFKIHSENPHS